MRTLRLFIFMALVPLFSSCIILHSTVPRGGSAPPWRETVEIEDAAVPGAHEQLHAVLWVQSSVEYDAVCRTAYSRARAALDAALADPRWTAALEQREANALPGKPAVIMDLDETVFDNAPYQAQLVLEGKAFDDPSWKRWVLRGEAGSVPGSLDFIRYAEGKGVTVLYVSNRDAESPGDRDSPQERSTRRNLEALGVSLSAEEDTILLKNEFQDWGSDKGTRRSLVARSYRILLLVGDDLGDFMSGIRTNPEDRAAKAAEHADLWGRAWIMLPNPMYGSWERVLSGPETRLTPAEALKRKTGRLRGMDEPR